MMLHKVIVRPGIRTSEKFGRLSWFHRDLFYGLLNAVHGREGWFEENAILVRAALYAPCLGKVSERDVHDGLQKLREVGLIKLWTGRNGRRYGQLINYNQAFAYGEALPQGAESPDSEPAAIKPAEGADPPRPRRANAEPARKPGELKGSENSRGATVQTAAERERAKRAPVVGKAPEPTPTQGHHADIAAGIY